MDIRYPQGDWTGTLPGAAEVEFQFYTYPLAILYKLFGVHEWFGRALNIAIYVPGAVLLFLLVRRLFGDAEALVAAFAYSFVPLSFFYTRTFQPDAFSAFFALLGVYAILRWIETDTWAFLALSVVGAALAGLLKPNNLHIGVPFAYLLYRRFGWRFIKKPVIWVFGVSVLLPVAAWYAHAYRLWVEYGNSYFRYYLIIGMYAVGASFTHVSGTLAMRLVKTIATPAGLPLMLLGLIQRPRDSNWVLHWWLAGFLASVAMAPRLHGGHDYYQLPAVFITSAWMGSGAVFLWTFQRSRRPILWRSLTIHYVREHSGTDVV